MPPARSPSRRASAYLLVLAFSLVLTSLGVGGMLAFRAVRARMSAIDADQDTRAAVQSGFDLALNTLDSDRDGTGWRTTGSLLSSTTINAARVRATATDPTDANLANYLWDPVVISVDALSPRAHACLSARLTPTLSPLNSLSDALASSGPIAFSGCTLYADGVVASNSSAATSGNCSIQAPVTAASISGNGYNAQTTAPIATFRQLPDASVFDYYIANGTTIPFSALPGSSIKQCVLSPKSNPFGATTNARGIYVINCAGSKITIQDCRIVGTLVLLDPKSDSSVTNHIVWSPADPSLPSLLVRGSIQVSMSPDPLTESGSNGNFNPIGTPYLGSEDIDTLDSYDSVIQGLVYVSSDVTLNGCSLEGVFLSNGTVTIKGSLAIRAAPPTGSTPGFVHVSRWRLDPGSVTRIVE